MTLVSILLVLFFFSIITNTLTEAHCLPDQRQALIQLKQGFNTTELHSWNASSDCCIWDGITCDEQTGMVTALNLTYRFISGELNPSLFNLSSLQYLDLSDNNFYNITLPQTGFERLSNLTHLNLSDSGFAGQVPMSISALTNLISLDLSYFLNSLYLPDRGLKTLLRNLTKLQVLRLDGVDISLNGAEWGKAAFQVGPTLQELSMADCGLRGNFPDEIFHLTKLTELDLSDNPMLSGKLPEFPKQSFLQYMYLGSTNLTGALPDSIANLQYISELDLLYCNFFGVIPSSISNLTKLEALVLASSKFTGTIPMSLFSHPSLKYLYLLNNQLSGYLPEFSNGSSILELIHLEDNSLQGQLSISRFIKHKKYLYSLDLSNNKLSIKEDENHNDLFYASFPQLEYLWLVSTNLTKFSSFLSYQTNIYSLDLSKNSLTEEIPLSICNVKVLDLSYNNFICNVKVLDLSYNNLTGTIPPCLLEDTELKVLLNLKSNKLSGPLPLNISQPCGLQVIILNGNIINGSVPKLLTYYNALKFSDLGNNKIVNRFPYWMGNLENLEILILGSNMLYGKISDVKIKTEGNDSFFPMLNVLDLSSNHFSGTLPKNIFVNLMAMKAASNTISLYNLDFNGLYIPYLDSITYKGMNFDLTYSLNIFNFINLSNNKFWGEIPEEIGQLKSLIVLNLSHNGLTGPIPSKFGYLEQLESLDLSFNQLSGPIPPELTSLTFLKTLNLSYNNLVGEIPEANQFSIFSNDSYLGNPRLCGSPLSIHCAIAPTNSGIDEGSPSKSSLDIVELSISIGLGLGVGFAFAIWATISWENGRKWFNLLIDRFYIRHFH